MRNADNGLKVVAIFEAFKGIVSLAVGLGIHEIAGKNIQQIMESLLSHLHLNPGSRIPGVMLHEASLFSNSSLTIIAAGALAYSMVRLIEAYGLWKGYLWVEWFALISGVIYIPLELYEVVAHKSGLSVLVLSINVVVVWYMYLLVREKPRDIKSG
jgi:uncharacterized membrane protein (DUF2068 family)